MNDALAAPAPSTLIDMVSSALESSPYFRPNFLRIEAEQGSVQIHGEVATFFEKQMAQETVRRLDGVERIENHLQVSWR